MRTGKEHFWQRPFSKRAALISVVVLGVVLILSEGYLGRTRLFVSHDQQYQFAFTLFVVAVVILMGALMVIGARVRTAKYRNNFNALQVSMGVLSFLSIALLDIFGDYTSSSLNAGSIVWSIVTATIIAVWAAMSMKRPNV